MTITVSATPPPTNTTPPSTNATPPPTNTFPSTTVPHPTTTSSPTTMTMNINCSEPDTYCKQNSDLKTIPTDIPTQTKTINLTSNSVQALDNNSFSGLTDVTTIDLSNNEIETVDNNSFAGLTNLTDLVLRHNNLSSLPTCLFREQNLRYLDLAFNNLTSIYHDLWLCLKSLETLIITGNPIIEISPGAFFPLSDLRTLYLDLHMLAKFCLPILNSMQNLKDVKLAVEDVKSLPCNSSSCYLKKLEDKGYMDHYTYKGVHSRPECSNRPGVYWDQMKDQLNCSTGSFHSVNLRDKILC